ENCSQYRDGAPERVWGGASRIWCGSDHRPGSGRISHWPGPGPDRITGWWYSACGTGPNSISGGRARAPLPRPPPASAGQCRIPQVSALAGAPRAPVAERFVRLSRCGVPATMPLKQLVAEAAEDIYAQPGDVLSVIRIPQTFSVFGATGRNAQIPFEAEGIAL